MLLDFGPVTSGKYRMGVLDFGPSTSRKPKQKCYLGRGPATF